MTNVVPWPTQLVKSIAPPCLSTTIERNWAAAGAPAAFQHPVVLFQTEDGALRRSTEDRVVGQLRAKANWHRIMREWGYDDPPATELGKAEAEYFATRA